MINNDSQALVDSTDSPESSIKICLATTLEEKREIYRFRYQTYVEEMSRHLEEVDYDNKLLYDEMDEWALLLYAKIGSEIIATKRINLGSISDFPQKVREFLSLEVFTESNPIDGNQKFAFITKVMVAPAYRSSPVLYLLMAKSYEICCHNNVHFIFGICNFHLLPLYEQIGCHRYYKNFYYPGHGLAVPIVMLTDDLQHFRQVRSPLYRVARKRGILYASTVEWFHTKFIKYASTINSQIVTEEEVWAILCKYFNCLPTEAITLLHELTVLEAKKFLHCCGIFVQCDPGNIITTQGDVSYLYNILLSGKLKSLTFQRPVKEYTTSGQHFGANGLTEHNKHTESIAVMSTSEILALSGIAFQKFYRSHPDIAHKIILRINKLTKIKAAIIR